MDQTSLRMAGVGVRLIGGVAVASAVLAASTIWLVLTNPATVTAALDQGTIAPLTRELAVAVLGVVRHLLAYL